ncbi:MAG: hypothetical protein ABIA04_09290 [Pseudomonadota bacterium]
MRYLKPSLYGLDNSSGQCNAGSSASLQSGSFECDNGGSGGDVCSGGSSNTA